jgi:hypothetical protein
MPRLVSCPSRPRANPEGVLNNTVPSSATCCATGEPNAHARYGVCFPVARSTSSTVTIPDRSAMKSGLMELDNRTYRPLRLSTGSPGSTTSARPAM